MPKGPSLPEIHGDPRRAVWLVDDSLLESEIAKRALQAVYRVFVYADASSMLEALTTSAAAPSALVLDWQMPGLSGLEACKFVRATRDQNALPILMLTGLSERANVVEAISAGANDYLTKPFDGSELLARVAALVRTKELHDRLCEAEARERAANQLKDSFLALASHELRTPLNAILGWVQLLRAGHLDSTGQFKAMETIERNALSQVRLIEDILDQSRITEGMVQLEIAPFDFSSLVGAAIDSVKPALDHKKITLRVHLDPCPALLNGDADRIQQVVLNLLTNARKFTPNGGHVEVRSERVSGGMRLTVSDDGVGIAAELLSKVFDRFRQAETSPSGRHGGLGLGLSLVHHFVEAHEGTVTVTSAGLGHGSTFVVTLPFDSARSQALRTSGDLVPPLDEARVENPPSAVVLVVDDNEANRCLAKSALEDDGYEVVLASGGAEGIAMFEAARPDCILLDVQMPVVNGFAVCERIRALPGGVDTPIIFLTAQRDVDTFDRAQRAGGDDFLTKPVRPTELVLRVEAALKLRRMNVELRGHYDLLKRQRDALLRVQLQKERLMAFVVHDLKNPVNAIDLHAQSLLRQKDLAPSVLESTALIRTETRRLTRMILNLLDLSKGDGGKLFPKTSSVDLGVLGTGIVSELEVTASSHNVKLECATDVGPVRADEDLLRRALVNLVENAIRHAPSGGVVRMTAAAGAGGVDLRVADTGEGVPAEMREKIFDPFVQLDGGNDEAHARGDRGLGLAFCKLAAEAHGGLIWLEDAAPGAAFCMRLPQ